MRTDHKHRLAWLALAAVLCLTLPAPGGAQIPGQSERAKRVGKRLMCMCGCNQVLVECNHVGCSMSTAMLQKLDERIAKNESDDLIIQSFIQEYGQKVLSQPPSSGFGLSAWVMPFVALLAGGVIILFVLQRWRSQHGAVAAGGAGVPISAELLERARRETEE
jgi:cytochrome c-type biogenesis protein CcmH